jgi:hypothetical protein
LMKDNIQIQDVMQAKQNTTQRQSVCQNDDGKIMQCYIAMLCTMCHATKQNLPMSHLVTFDIRCIGKCFCAV